MTVRERAGAFAVVFLAGGVYLAQAQIPVTDVTAVPAWATKLANDITMIEHAAVTIMRIEQLTANLEYQAQYLENTVTQWGWLTHPWTGAYFADSTGINTGWLGAINSDIDTINAYSRMVGTLDTDLHYYPAGLAPDAMRAIAMIERMDGHAQQSTSIVGQYTGANPEYQGRIQRLANSVYSMNPDDNTAVAQAQKTNAGLMLQIEAANMQAELQKKNLEQQTELLILQRERLAAEINSNAHFYATVGSLQSGAGGDLSARINTQ